MSNINNNELLLNYHDAVIRSSDLAVLLSPTEWMNDASIHFYLTRLSHSIPLRPHVQCQFVDPSVLSFLMHQWDPEDDGGNPAELLGLLDWRSSATNLEDQGQSQKEQQRRTKLVFFPISDNYVSHSWRNPGGGTHWTLLVLWLLLEDHQTTSPASCVSNDCSFWHFDSSPFSDNHHAASAVARKLSLPTMQVDEYQVPRQQNGYDCGLHMIATAKALASILTAANNTEQPRAKALEDIVQNHVATSPDFCHQLRQEIVKDIQSLVASVSDVAPTHESTQKH